MKFKIRPLSTDDEPILWEMLYQGLSSSGTKAAPPRDIVQRPEYSRFVQNWGQTGDTGFVAHDEKDNSLLGAVWLRKPNDKSPADTPSVLTFAVKPGHRGHGIGTALLTQLVRANPERSKISITSAAGKPLLRLYERFGFMVAEERPDAVVMQRHA